MSASFEANHSDNRSVLKTRISAEMKLRLGALAKKRGVNRSTLVRQLIAKGIGPSEPVSHISVGAQKGKEPEPRGLAVALNAADRRALRERAKARDVRVSRYLTALVRAHLKNDIRPMAAEMAMMRDLVAQLNTIGIGLNHLVRAANDGVVWAGPLKEILQQILVQLETLGPRLATFGQASRDTWQLKIED